MRRAAAERCKIDVLVESDCWNEADGVTAMVRRAVTEAADALSADKRELAVVLSDDSTIRLLNRDWRGADTATNVLSFPTPDSGGDPALIGDIVLAYETIAREASAEHKPFIHHVAHLVVHGFLHLCGYDHQREKDAVAMEELERKILRRLSIPDPYRARPGKRGRIANAR